MKTFASLSIVVLTTGLVACGGGGTKVKQDAGTDIPVVDTPVDPGIVETVPERIEDVSGPKTLSFVIENDDTNQNCIGKTSCNISLSYSQEREVAVLFTQGKTPIPSAAILWEIQEDTKNLGTLEAAQAYTDKDGLASNKIIQNKENLKPGTFKVRIWVDGDDTVTPLYFNVTVTPKGVIPLSVRFADYKGAYPMLDQGKVRLFKQNLGKPACADLSVDKLPTATVASPTFPLTQATTFPELPNLETEQTQTYTIVGLASVGAGPVQAWACDDKQGVVNWGQPTVVELVLQDLSPKIKGSYDITSTFDLVSGLPPAVANVINIVVGFFESPTAQIMILICKTGGSSGFLHDFCGYMFSDPANPVIDKLTGTGEIVFKIIDTILISLLQSQCPFTDKSLCGKIYFTGKDISQIIKQFTIVSTFTFSEEPDKDGKLPATACKEVWHSVKLKWTLGKDCPPTDEACGQMNFSFGAIPGIEETISANFEAQIIDHNKMAILPHKLNLKYGALVDFAIEKVLLPQVFGDGKDGLPAVDSYEKLIGSLLGGKACLKKDDCCSIFAQNVTSQTSGLTTNLVEGACEALRTTGATYLRNTLMDLDATPDNFTIGTLEPCPITDDDKNMTFDSFGKKNAQCKWDATLTISGTDYKPEGTFYGTAK